MQNIRRKTLVVIGAGPKGIAVAVKAKVLEEFGVPVDRVILIEKNEVGANWTGSFGYTNGEMKLGTSPEKDVVFPIETSVGDEVLDSKIRQRLLQFTWNSFLIQTQRFSDWVDRGRPAPCHQLWSLYLRWVSESLASESLSSGESIVRKGEVVKIDLSEDKRQWKLTLRETEGIAVLFADGLMLTGPGSTRMDFLTLAKSQESDEDLKGVYDLESFWGALKNKQFSTAGRVAIVGVGENAASTLLALSQYAPDLRVDLISPKGYISTRSENYYENQVYSQPERNKWNEMDYNDRMEFIERTDLGVFSSHAMNILNQRIRHQVVPGRVVALTKKEDALSLSLEYKKETSLRTYDQVILATGFDQVAALRELLTQEALEELEKALSSRLEQEALRMKIAIDLSVEGMTPALYLPMLAGLRQGPGFGNLSCLGRLSDRVLRTNTLRINTLRINTLVSKELSELPNKIRFVDSSFKLEIEELRKNEYAKAKGFDLDLNTLAWNASDDESFVMAAELKGQIVSTMRGEVIDNIKMLEKKLECPWNFPVSLEMPILLLSRAATVSAHRTLGLNLILRYWFLKFAKAHGIRYVVGTFVSGSPRQNTLHDMGYKFFENTLGWQQSSYRSLRPVIVAVLDMKNQGAQALKYCQDRVPMGDEEYFFEGHFPKLNYTRNL